MGRGKEKNEVREMTKTGSDMREWTVARVGRGDWKKKLGIRR
jgi:hypothetical protein